MLSILLLTASIQFPVTSVEPVRGGGEEPPKKITSMVDTADREDDPRSLGALPVATSFVAQGFGATVISPLAFGVGLGGRAPVIEVLLTGLSTGFAENFVVQLPRVFLPEKNPLLMVFHKFGSKADDPYNNTGYPQECADRNWFMISSLGATKKSFSSLASQENRETSLEWLMSMFGPKIDTERVYGVGFSMGGGSVANYAARHLDPDGVQLAAIVDHTGSVSQLNTWQLDSPVRYILEYWFEGEPWQTPFFYQRSSVVEFDKTTLAVYPDVCLAWNLKHVPTMVSHADQDPLAYLVDQSIVLKDFLISIGGTVVYKKSSAGVHDWKTLKARDACDFLSAFVLEHPQSGHTLADRDGKFFAFDIEQGQSGVFSTFDWAIDIAANRLSLQATKNVDVFSVDTDLAQLDTEKDLEVVLSAGDFFADTVELDGYAQAPKQVLRAGVPSSAWNWEPTTGTVVIFEQSIQSHTWLIQP